MIRSKRPKKNGCLKSTVQGLQFRRCQASIVQAINTALGGEDVSYLHTEHNTYPAHFGITRGQG